MEGVPETCNRGMPSGPPARDASFWDSPGAAFGVGAPWLPVTSGDPWRIPSMSGAIAHRAYEAGVDAGQWRDKGPRLQATTAGIPRLMALGTSPAVAHDRHSPLHLEESIGSITSPRHRAGIDSGSRCSW